MYVYIYIHIVHIVYILYLYIHFMYVIYIIYALAIKKIFSEQKCSLYLVLLGRFGYLTTFHKLSYSFFHKQTVFHP